MQRKTSATVLLLKAPSVSRVALIFFCAYANSWAQVATNAIDRLAAIAEAHPSDPLAHDELGIALAEGGRNSEAIDEFTKAASLSPDFADAHLHLALSYQRAGQTRQALPEFETVLRLAPEGANVRYALSAACWTLGDQQGAITLLRQIVAENPPFVAEALYNLGIELRQTGKLQSAVDALRTANARKPDYAEALLVLGE